MSNGGKDTSFSCPIYARQIMKQLPYSVNTNGCSFEDKTNDFLCPICFEIIDEAYITRCGHTYCYRCILKTLESNNSRCPKCSVNLNDGDLFPNFLLNELIVKYKYRRRLTLGRELTEDGRLISGASGGQYVADNLRYLIAYESKNLTLPDVNVMLETLKKRKQHLEAESRLSQNRLVREFLKNLLKLKERQLCDVTKEVSVIKKDIERVEEILNISDDEYENEQQQPDDNDNDNDEDDDIIDIIDNSRRNSSRSMLADCITTNSNNLDESYNSNNNQHYQHRRNNNNNNTTKQEKENFNSVHMNTEITGNSFLARNKIVQAHFDDFVKCYFSCRAKQITFGAVGHNSNNNNNNNNNNMMMMKSDDNDKYGLDVFRENLVKFSRYSKLRPIATLNYSNDVYNNSTIVSSIEFDKDDEYFAIAGVTKRIKVYDYDVVTRDIVDIHYPACEMTCSSKISCVSWNNYLKSVLASSDYEGTITLWDTAVTQRIKIFQEHEKRCWSVDFNNVDSRLIASGSDDARVKLWSINLEHSIASLEARANVCCVKFNPQNSYHLAFGSADHSVHYYDLRNTKQALIVFKGHKKAVSYVKFLNERELVSASTDSQLKLWNVLNGSSGSHCLRSFTGHVNDKNFVGLATDGDYVACGSENNSLYVYYKGLSKPLLNCKFDCSVRNVVTTVDTDQKEDEVNEFVSAVCWRRRSNVMIAANSQGIIKVLELN